MAHPFVKWAGGKNQLLSEIRTKYPKEIEKYCEPFVGGGAVLWDVLEIFDPKEILINDINESLINTYMQVKNNCGSLVAVLKKLQNDFLQKSDGGRQEMFYEKRERFNLLEENLEKAAIFIFLNKTCFNGLYRVNKKGLFNVPFNHAKNPAICDAENLFACSKLLHNVQIKCGDYSVCSDFIDEKTFVYIDPPYRPLSMTAAFTSYNENDTCIYFIYNYNIL